MAPGQGVALSVSSCGLGKARTESVTFFSSEISIRTEIQTRNRPELMNRARPKLCGKHRIARLSLSVHWAGVIPVAECGHRSCTAGSELVERLGQRVLPVFFPIGPPGGAGVFTPSGAAFEISRPPPPSQAPGPISQNLSLGTA